MQLNTCQQIRAFDGGLSDEGGGQAGLHDCMRMSCPAANIPTYLQSNHNAVVIADRR